MTILLLCRETSLHLFCYVHDVCMYVYCCMYCMSLLDIDECAEDLDNCDENALCINTPGSFECVCIEVDGFTGDGVTCVPSEWVWSIYGRG